MHAELVKLTPTKNACSRTQNRLRQHGPVFRLLREDTPSCFLGQRSVYVESEHTLWRGWLPISEVEMDVNQGDW